jgi:hypothetical protein
MQACGWSDEQGHCVLVDCKRSTRCAWGVTVSILSADMRQPPEHAMRGRPNASGRYCGEVKFLAAGRAR